MMSNNNNNNNDNIDNDFTEKDAVFDTSSVVHFGRSSSREIVHRARERERGACRFFSFVSLFIMVHNFFFFFFLFISRAA
jgi:hypothetical protein